MSSSLSLRPPVAAPTRRQSPERFLESCESLLRCALQPIVEVHTGALYGVEALVRGFEALRFGSPFALLDHAADAGLLRAVEALLNRKAVEAFALLPDAAQRRLFLNVDGRSLVHGAPTHASASGNGVIEAALAEVRAAGLPASCLCIELSERHETATLPGFRETAEALRRQGVRFAADDFGQGFSELRLLFDGGIDYVKVDRHFVANLAQEPRKRLFVGQIASFAHVLGLRVIAEGVEDEADFLACRELGCDMIQGWYVARPTTDPGAIRPLYEHVGDAAGRERRQRQDAGELDLVCGAVERIEAVPEDADIERVFDLLRQSSDLLAVPVVDRAGAPRGLVRERDLRRFIYDRFGRDLLRNPNVQHTVGAFLVAAPMADLRTDTDTLLRVFAAAPPGCEGILLHDAGRYVGLVSAAALLRMLNEKRVRLALDQNPLTRLPGNLSVAAHAAAAAVRSAVTRHLCYFDFDHFKPFNDRFGFRQGDRAIALFAEAMRRHLPESEGAFLGHIGGDDFFAGLRGLDRAELEPRLLALLGDFAESVAGFHSAADLAARSMSARDRDGTARRFPLLRCSVGVLEIPAGRPAGDADRLLAEVARLKSAAKAADAGLAWHATAT